jgi:hypothetical protein
MTEFLPTVDLSEGIIRDGIHKTGTNLGHSLNKNYTSDATRNTIQRESVQNTIGDMTTQGN